MSIHEIADLLLWRTWWAYDANSGPLGQVYRTFNLIEGTAWLVFAVLVWRRYAERRNSPVELLYGFAFVTFGLSDFREAHSLQSWLILFKAVNLLSLLYLRSIVIRRYYPASKTY